MKLEKVKIDDLISPEYNPRQISSVELEKLKTSLNEFGYISPIIVNEYNNHIVGGNQRCLALKQLGYTMIDVIYINEPDLNKEKALNIRLNNLSGEWDMTKLEKVIDELKMEKFDITLTGFEIDNVESFDDLEVNNIPFNETITEDIDKNLKEEKEYEEPIEVTNDNYNEPDNITVTVKQGELYQLGNHRLLCGDSTNPNDVSVLMRGGEHGKMLFTSPPYADLRDYHTDDNNLDLNNIVKFLSAYQNYADYQCVNLGIIYRNKEVHQYWDKYIEYAKEHGLKLLSWNVWDKIYAGSVGPQQRMFPLCHEWIFVFGKEPLDINRTIPKKESNINVSKTETLRRNKDGNTYMTGIGDTSNPYKKMGTVIRQLYELGKIRHKHPATFPVQLPAEYIKAMTNENDIVIDCFGGSGTTLIACEQLNRKARLMELSPEYCQVIINRWEEFTGEKAEKIGG